MMQACRLAGKTAKKHARALNRCGLVYWALMALWCGLGTALGQIGLPTGAQWIIMGYLYGVIGLGMSALLLSAVRRTESGIRFGGRAAAILLALPALYLAPISGAYALWRYADVQWQSLMAQALGSGAQMALSAAVLCAILCAGLWVFCAIGSFARLSLLRAMREDSPIRAREWGALAAQGLRRSLAPAGLFLCHLPFFLLAGALWLALEAGAGLLLGTFSWQAEFSSTALLYLAHLLTPHPWLSAAAFFLGPVCLLGLGLWFWPRYQLAKVCYFFRAGRRFTDGERGAGA